jgi:hypothetical protein
MVLKPAHLFSVIFAAATLAGADEPVRVPLKLRDGLLYVSVHLVGCVRDAEVELLLDTGATSTVLPHAHMRRMRERGGALDLGSVRVELVNGGTSEAREALIDGVRIGTCELLSVRGISCPEEDSAWRPVLGMDVLSRLSDVTISLGGGGSGELRFTCPSRPAPVTGECAPP